MGLQTSACESIYGFNLSQWSGAWDSDFWGADKSPIHTGPGIISS